MRAPERVTIRDLEGNGVSFTATTRDVPSMQVDVTQHTVEQGANILDHARAKLITLSLEGVVSDISDGAGVAQGSLLFFVGLRNTPRVVEIITPRIVYDSMLMVRLDMPRKASDGQAQRFVTDWLEYRVATIRRTVVQVNLAKPAPKGTQPKKVVAAVDNRPVLKKLSDEGGGGVGGLVEGIRARAGAMLGVPRN